MIEGRRDLGDILADAFQELRAARTTIVQLQAELAAAPLTSSRADEQNAPSPRTAPERESPAAGRAVATRIGAVRPPLPLELAAEEPSESAADLFDGPLPSKPAALAAHLRSSITSALYLGTLSVGDRLPFIREAARRTGLNHKIVSRVYRTLERERLLEIRARSGIYVAEALQPAECALTEEDAWIARVVTEAASRGLATRQLPELLRTCTEGESLRCACVDSTVDDRTALCREAEEYFGVEAVPVDVDAPDIASAIAEADLVLTTPFHAGWVRAAMRPDQPLVVADLHPAVRAALQTRVKGGICTLVCVDAASGERLLRGLKEEDSSQVRIVSAEDAAATGLLEECGPGFLTRAAWERMGMGGGTAPQNLAVLPCLSPRALHEMAQHVTLLNRSTARD